MKRLAITGRERIEVIDYTEREVQEDELLVRTEIASGKHGTVSALRTELRRCPFRHRITVVCS